MARPDQSCGPSGATCLTDLRGSNRDLFIAHDRVVQTKGCGVWPKVNIELEELYFENIIVGKIYKNPTRLKSSFTRKFELL